MVGASLGLTSPVALVLCALALVPLGVLALGLRRNRGAARVLGLPPAGSRDAWPRALAIAGVCVLVGLAAAQPVIQTTETRRVRTESEVMFVIDVTRSMAAGSSSQATTRLERARVIAGRLRSAVPEVPAGVSGLTDRVLPYLFATSDERAFAETLRRSVGIQTPPPQEVAAVATSFAALPALARDGFFSGAAARRTCVLVTDGESVPFSAVGVGRRLRGTRGCRLVVVHVWREGERVFRPDGTPEANYRSAADARSNVDRLAAAAGGATFAEDELDAATAALQAAAVAGPEGRRTEVSRQRSLAPWLAGLAFLLVSGLVAARLAALPRSARSSMYYRAREP